MASPSPRVEASSSPSNQPDEVVASHNELHYPTGHGEITLVRRASVKVAWTAATYNAILDIRHDAVQSEAWLALRFPNIALREKNSVSFFVAFAPEDMESLTFLGEGNEYNLGVRLRRPPGVVGPDCTWTDQELSGADTLTVKQLQTLGLETSCTILVPAKAAKRTQLKLFCETISKGATRSLKRYYNTASLYGGEGGRRFGLAEAGCPPSYAQLDAGVGHSATLSATASAAATYADQLPTYGAIAAAESSQGQERAIRPPKRPRRSMSTEEQPDPPPCRKCEDATATMNKKMDDIMSQLSQLTEVNRPLKKRMEEEALTVASLNEHRKRPRSNTRASARRRKRFRSSNSSPEVETASAGYRKCDELFPFLTQKLGVITTQLTQLTGTNRRINARIAAVEAHLAAQVQARAADDEARSAAVVEQVRRSASVKEVRESLIHEVVETIRSQFVESDVLVETVAATVNAEMDGVSDYLERLKEYLKVHLKEYLASDMRGEGE